MLPERQGEMDSERRLKRRGGARSRPTRFDRRCCPEELWRLRDTVPKARDELINRHMGFARGIAVRFRTQREPVEDVIQVSYLGLVNAVDRFELERHIPFEAFAAPTIRGEVLRHLRDNTSPVHVNRGLKVLARRVERAREELTARSRKDPGIEEIAAFLDEDPELVREAIGAREAGFPVSLDPVAGEDDSGQPLVGEIDRGYSRVETRVALERAGEVLSDDERLALGLRFGGDLSQSEIAELLGVSQMTVSRRVRRGLAKLESELGEEGAEGHPRLN